jgi:hypothetical protein
MADREAAGKRRHHLYSPAFSCAISRGITRAAASERNFLNAGLVARTHGLCDDTAISPAAISFTPSVESTLGSYLDRLIPVGRSQLGTC